MAAKTAATMRAVVMHEVGGPEVLKVQSWPIPKPKPGEVLIRVKAIGLNRSEMYTRQGHSPDVKFPRVLGIEAVGLVEECPDGVFTKNDTVATAMGGMGRQFDGGYAEFTCVPVNQVQVIKTKLSWEQFGALPEMMNTVWGSLFKSLRLQKDDHLLIRGGTSSVGLAAAAIAKSLCAYVAVTTRKAEREQMLKANGANEVYIDTGSIAEEVKKRHPEKFSKILELVGVTTMVDSMQCTRSNGIVCLTGIAGGKWIIENFSPVVIPSSVCLTTFGSTIESFMATPLDEIAKRIADGSLKIPIKTFPLDHIVEAHKAMDNSTAMAKIVVTV